MTPRVILLLTERSESGGGGGLGGKDAVGVWGVGGVSVGNSTLSWVLETCLQGNNIWNSGYGPEC